MKIAEVRHFVDPAPKLRRFFVVKMGILPVNLAGADRHWAIEKHAPAIQLPFLVVFTQVVQDFLATTDRKGGNQKIALFVSRVGDDVADLIDGCLPVPMQPVAIGALNDAVYAVLDDAAKRTKANRRSTVKPQDL